MDELKSLLAVGDSLVFGMRKDIFSSVRLINHGVPGDETVDVINRLDPLLEINADVVLILVGINDFLRNRKRMIIRDDKTIVKNIVAIGQAFLNRMPSRLVMVASLLPVSEHPKYVTLSDIGPANKAINHLNDLLKIEVRHTKMAYLNLNRGLSIEDRLGVQYTVDGIHLSPKGYILIHELMNEDLMGSHA